MITCTRCEGMGSVGVFRSVPVMIQAIWPQIKIDVPMYMPVLEAQRLLESFEHTSLGVTALVTTLAPAVEPTACPSCDGWGKVEPYDDRKWSIAPVEIDPDGCARSRESIERAETEWLQAEPQRRVRWVGSV